MARTYERVPFPELFPAFSAMVVDDEGNLWLREYMAPRAKEARWTIMNDRGAVEAHIDLPSQLTVLRVTPDEITGVWRDDLNVESVRIFTYTRVSQG
jgi:hypothetical protein